MSDELALQKAIDLDPTEFTPRAILVDYLQERDDPRWMGYQVLVKLQRHPCMRAKCAGFHDGDGETAYSEREVRDNRDLMNRWLNLGSRRRLTNYDVAKRMMTMRAPRCHAVPRAWFNATWGGEHENPRWILSPTRADLENMMANVLATMPKAYRDGLLAVNYPESVLFEYGCPRCNGCPGNECKDCKGYGKLTEYLA